MPKGFTSGATDDAKCCRNTLVAPYMDAIGEGNRPAGLDANTTQPVSFFYICWCVGAVSIYGLID